VQLPSALCSAQLRPGPNLKIARAIPVKHRLTIHFLKRRVHQTGSPIGWRSITTIRRQDPAGPDRTQTERGTMGWLNSPVTSTKLARPRRSGFEGLVLQLHRAQGEIRIDRQRCA